MLGIIMYIGIELSSLEIMVQYKYLKHKKVLESKCLFVVS